MNPQELANQCATSINFTTEIKLPMEQACITITTSKGWKAPPKFPRGKLLQVKEDGRRIWSLSAVKTIAWLTGNGLVNVEVKTR